MRIPFLGGPPLLQIQMRWGGEGPPLLRIQVRWGRDPPLLPKWKGGGHLWGEGGPPPVQMTKDVNPQAGLSPKLGPKFGNVYLNSEISI